jgi:hypothetical protein
MIKKVLTVGCSFTYGDELSDRENTAWPYLLAKQNNWQVINLGKSGGSNDRSIRIAFNEIKNQYDLIIVAWTVNSRFEVPYETRLIDINPQFAKKLKLDWVDDYYKYHYDREYNYGKWFREIIMLQSYFKQMNQKYLFCSTFGIWSDLRGAHFNHYMSKYSDLMNQVDKTYYIDWPMYGMTDWMGDCPKGPGGHPLELGHQRIAEKINEHIGNIGWLS